MATKITTPREVLDARLATLTPEQRARVSVREYDHFHLRCFVVEVDGVGTDTVTVIGRDHSRDHIDSMLAALDAALAKATPQAEPLRECVEDIEAERDELRAALKRSRDSAEYVVAEHNAVYADRDRWKQAAHAATRERDAFREALRVSEDDCERLHVRLNRLVGERKAVNEGSGER